jgi:hypothetical protein
MAQVKSKDLNDPFFTLREYADTKVSELDNRMDRWERALIAEKLPAGQTFKNHSEKVNATLARLKTYLNDMEKMVRSVERAPSKFPNITSSELQARRTFVNLTNAKIKEATARLNSPRARDKLKEEERSELLHQPRRGAKAGMSTAKGGKVHKGYNSLESGNDSFLLESAAGRQEIVKKQDVVLESMEGTVTRLGGMAEQINIELGEQNDALKDFDKTLEDNLAGMNIVMQGMGKALKTSNTCHLWLIFFLTVSFCILFMIYTTSA